jgi:hypothetical protein
MLLNGDIMQGQQLRTLKAYKRSPELSNILGDIIRTGLTANHGFKIWKGPGRV